MYYNYPGYGIEGIPHTTTSLKIGLVPGKPGNAVGPPPSALLSGCLAPERAEVTRVSNRR